MKICDRCDKPTVAMFTVRVVEDDSNYDLCKKHKDEIAKLICTKESKKPLFGGKKNSVKTG